MSFSRCWPTVLFWALTFGAILPLWAFPYIPTQDGPSHLANARILERLIAEDPLYTKVFDIREEPLPNWTTQAVLWFLLLIVPAAVAEKLLLTGYVIGFSWSYRRLALALRPEAVVVPLLGVLFCYCRCFWMGFYNYCLSMILLFGLLGILAQHRRLTWGSVFLLAYFGVLAYFTHLLGFLMTVGASLLAIFCWYESRWSNLGRAVLAWVPSGCLGCWYLLHTGTLGGPFGRRWLQSTSGWLFSSRALDVIEDECVALSTQIYGPLGVGTFPAGWCLVAIFLLLFYITLARIFLVKETATQLAPWPMLVMFVLVTLAYFLGPEHLGLQQGGYLKQRFAVLVPLFLALVYREPTHAILRWGLLMLLLTAYALLAANVWQTFADGNREIIEFTAGREALGSGRTVFVMQPDTTRIHTSDPLLHAADYYCADAANVNLDNYQAVTKHFPVCFVPGQRRGLGHVAHYSRREIVEAILVWDRPDPGAHPALSAFAPAFSEGRLKIYLRK